MDLHNTRESGYIASTNPNFGRIEQKYRQFFDVSVRVFGVNRVSVVRGEELWEGMLQ